ncbi:histone acetyltransferase subunit NuA4-domain-containing protein, partial [Aspergillus filifer]
MADTATATSAAPVANTPTASGQGQGRGQGTELGENNSQPQQSQPQSQSTTNQSQPQPNSASTPTTANNENAPPDTRENPNQPANRGLPYYEKLRRELRDTLQKKRLMDKSMAQLEDQIYRFEQSYLEETTAGNIIKGFDNYIKGSSTGSSVGAGGIISAGGGGGTSSRRKAAVTDGDRVFSRSSASFMRDSPAPSSAQTTPSHAPTPTSTYNGSGGNKANGTSGDTSSAAGSVKGGSSKNTKKKASTANRG